MRPFATAFSATQLVHRLDVTRLAVRRKAHDLALVAVLRKAEPLRDGRVEDPERVREQDAVEHAEARAAPMRENRAREVAEAVDGEDGGLLERRDEEGAGDVGLMVLDVVHPRSDRVPLHPEGLGELAAHAGGVLESLLQEAEARRVAERAEELLPRVRLRVGADGDVVDVGDREAGVRETPSGCLRRKPRAVLDSVEALLLGRRDELALHDERRGGVAVVGVESEDGSRGDASAHRGRAVSLAS